MEDGSQFQAPTLESVSCPPYFVSCPPSSASRPPSPILYSLSWCLCVSIRSLYVLLYFIIALYVRSLCAGDDGSYIVNTSSVVDSVRIGDCVSGVYTGVRVGGVCHGGSNWSHSRNHRLYMYVLFGNITGGIVNIGFSSNLLVYVRLSSDLFFGGSFHSRDLLMDISFGNITGSIVDIGESCRSLLSLRHGGSKGQGDNGQKNKG